MSEPIARTTILDIARELNVAAATVSRALNDHPAISTATREAVKQAARRMNYQPNKIASSFVWAGRRSLALSYPVPRSISLDPLSMA